jgi:hypothetical protein
MVKLPFATHLKLAQGARGFRVVVTDIRGTPFRNAQVTAGNTTLLTDSSGHAVFEGASGSFEVTVDIGDMVIRRKADASETLFVHVPVCSPEPFLTNTEIVALLGAAALAGAGFYWKKDVLSVTGQVFFGAAAFTAIYRHSCSW